MISTAYINNGCEDSLYTDECSVFERYLATSLEDIYTEYWEMKSNVCRIMLESEIMGDITEGDRAFLESENDSFVSKVGRKIVELTNKFIELIDKLIQKVKDFSFGIKSNEKKMDTLIKEHPELTKEKIQILCDAGGLEFSDMRSLAELDKTFNQILEMSKKKDVDPKSLRGKWDAAVKKLNSDNSSAKAIATAAKTITATIAVGVAIHEFKSKIVGAKKRLDEDRKSMVSMKAKLHERVTSETGSKVTTDSGVATTLLAMYRELLGHHEKAVQRDASILNKMSNAIAAFIDGVADSNLGKSVLGDKKGSFHKDMAYTRQKDSDEKTR